MSVFTMPANGQIISVIQGEYAVSDQPDAVMTTVLGSCISACLYDPVRQVGGMNHFLLPEAQSGSGKDVKYGAYLMELLINTLLKKGAARQRLRAKLAGGAQMSRFLSGVGSQNIDFALRYLQNEGIAVDWQSLGGGQARRIHFVPTTGQLSEKFVRNDDQIDAPRDRIPRTRIKPDIELF